MTEFATLRAKATAMLTGAPFDPADPAFAAPLARLDASATTLRDTIDLSPSRTSLWPDLPLNGASGDISSSHQRLRTLATAWATPGSKLHDDTRLATDLLSALDFLYARAYNETKKEVGNWWHCEIGAPRALIDTCLLMYDVIAPEQRAAWIRGIDRFCPNPDADPPYGRTHLSDHRPVRLATRQRVPRRGVERLRTTLGGALLARGQAWHPRLARRAVGRRRPPVRPPRRDRGQRVT
ncbi:hypothetical protein AB0B45_27435 [Nonomuraea sp. NPDC049152]|uniref:hypothetical protein n=1 Tax=Nonomuraea sp. NPDC049152 TaxID=3154350 RepID=UPI0034033B84